MERVMRDFFLFLSKNRPMTKVAKQYGLRFGAARFVAGETVEQAVESIQFLNKEGLCVTLDCLGEFVDNEKEAGEMTELCIEAVQAIGAHKLDSQLSLKLTSMGLDLSEEVALENMRRIMDAAVENNVFVTIDMEDYERCQKTLNLFKQLKGEYENIGTVIQAYLYRTEGDIADLNSYSPNLRLVKGAYKESHEVAFPEKKEVDDNFKKIIKAHLLNGNYTAIATHDDQIIEYTKNLVKEHAISNDQFEFQMLYGICEERQRDLHNQGYKMRVYMPFGTDWYGYFMRRLAERPANVAFVARGIFNK
ncbi:proline dehydrogenase family protein [Jeotgalibacillus campisalis]|uniref:proline dehydrogenase n=1 Tax=Jeotgalibacillus campisalis TaxID=220754 RepID=A0A0C2V3V8_9BACL|nr:proline dehydrogenase [Jeotgalibacillus campisalis]KIL43722.1 proline dehydrogenase [Jeotgalibacillus campisalis]